MLKGRAKNQTTRIAQDKWKISEVCYLNLRKLSIKVSCLNSSSTSQIRAIFNEDKTVKPDVKFEYFSIDESKEPVSPLQRKSCRESVTIVPISD